MLSILDIIGTLLGNMLLNHINENVLKVIIFFVMILSSLTSLLKVKSSRHSRSKISKAIKRRPIIAPVGLVSGLTTGTTGLSASTMSSSYLIGLLDFSPSLAVAWPLA
ncbi:TSUP family transporter [Acetobacterium paludosum]|uniref:TSUP family transporter n=1 Tax=Acetobacterium paludosum TaxID=52693 RepID=UPI003B75BDC0